MNQYQATKVKKKNTFDKKLLFSYVVNFFTQDWVNEGKVAPIRNQGSCGYFYI